MRDVFASFCDGRRIWQDLAVDGGDGGPGTIAIARMFLRLLSLLRRRLVEVPPSSLLRRRTSHRQYLIRECPLETICRRLKLRIAVLLSHVLERTPASSQRGGWRQGSETRGRTFVAVFVHSESFAFPLAVLAAEFVGAGAAGAVAQLAGLSVRSAW